jgi:hypothetical protein
LHPAAASLMASSVAEELLLINVSRCLRAKLACVDAKQLTESFAGREFDDALHVDPCGERGEFHTCVYAGPMFTAPVRLEGGEAVDLAELVFADFKFEFLRQLRRHDNREWFAKNKVRCQSPWSRPPLHFISHLAPVARIVCQPSQVCVTHSRASILNSGTIHLIKKTRSRVLLLRSDKNDCRSQNASMRRQ